MTQLEHQIHTTQRRLWFNRWLHDVSLALALAACTFALVVLMQRLYDLPIPLRWVMLGFGVVAVGGSIILTIARREDSATAAATLDQAAGLRERISTAQFCLHADDPFARAVVADAERISASVSARSHIRLQTPRRLGLALGSFILAASMFLITPGLLKPTQAKEADKAAVEREQAKLAVKKQFDAVRQLTETTPALADLQEPLGDLDKLAGGQLQKPSDIRHEAVKKIDRMEDAVRQKMANDEYEAIPQMRKMLRGLKTPGTPEAPTQKLAEALQKGDFKTAKEEAEALRDQLATLKSEQDKELVEKMSKQLEDLAKQLEKVAIDEKLLEKLEQLGLKKEDIERMLERLGKSDLEQLKKQLEEKGLNQQQIEKMAKQLQQRQQAGAMSKKLADAMKQSSKANQPAQMSNAMAGMSQAADQLSELEQLEQEMNQLDSAMAALQDARDQIDKQCPS